MVDDEALVKEVRERCRKQDPTLKIVLKPRQFFIGNHAMKLNMQSPFVMFEQNRSRKMSLRFYVGNEPIVGYTQQDFGVSLTQIECISVKDEERDHPPVLTCRMLVGTMERIYKFLTGLQPVVEKEVGVRNVHSCDLTFFLQPVDAKSDYYVEARFGEPQKSHHIEFESFRSLLVEDLVPVWTQMLSEAAKKRRSAGMARTRQLVSKMDAHGLLEHLTNLKLRRCKGSELYERNLENVKKRPISDGEAESSLAVKRPKMTVPKQIRKLLLDVPNSNRVEDRRVFTQIAMSLVNKFVTEQHNDPDWYPVIFTREVLQEMKRRDELAKLVEQVNKQFSHQAIEQSQPQVYPEYQENYPQYPHDSYIPTEQLNQFFGKQDAHLVNYQHNGITEYKQVDELLNEDEMAEFFQPPSSGDYYGQQMVAENAGDHNQQKRLEEMSPSPELMSVGSAVGTPKSRDNSYVSSETQLFTFPPRDLMIPGIDPVNLMVRDVRTLDRKEFVNDNVMSFMLNYIAVYMIDKELMSRIHMCNTFFYSNLTRQIPTLVFSGRRKIEPHHQQQLVDNCSRVLRWTKKFDVFKKDYIVVPINEDYHWLLITVFNPAGAIVDMSNEEESRKKPKCYVAFFDPLSGLDPVKGNHMTHCIRTYLEELYDKTKSKGKRFAEEHETVFDSSRVIITRPQNLPVQDNFYDCGLYALHFIEGLFCYLDRPITVHNFPDFDWSARYPAANEMANLMRDKIYNLVLTLSDKTSRSRLARYERMQFVGLSQEGDLRRSRRHSADRLKRVPRHEEYRRRMYSVSPPSRNVMEDPMFMNPRAMVEMPATRKVRAMRWPEENFPIIY